MASDLSLTHLSNQAVIAEVVRLAGAERQATAQLVAALAELDARRLYLGEGCSSLFTYCTSVLHLSEHAAYSRIEAARAGRRGELGLLDRAEWTETLEPGTFRTIRDWECVTPSHADACVASGRCRRDAQTVVSAVRPVAATGVCPVRRECVGGCDRPRHVGRATSGRHHLPPEVRSTPLSDDLPATQ